MKALIGWFREFKVFYMVYNLFQYQKLKHNLPKFKAFGVKKFYFSPISSADFPKNQIKPKTSEPEKMDPVLAAYKSQFDQQGFLILPGHFSSETADQINAEVDQIVNSGQKQHGHRNKLMFAIDDSDFLMGIGKDPQIQLLLNCLLGDKAVLFQSINFDSGSEQASHSDSIHMTTYPLGGLIAIWIALEDVEEDQGPLHYYPGSHLLPYYMNADYGNQGNFFRLGTKGYAAYEAMMAEKMKENKMEKTVFKAKKGDVLIWHANLSHGGNLQTNKTKTRKSMVLHYFAEHCICFHEITQRPALIDPKRFL